MKQEILLQALSKKLRKNIIDANYQTQQLKGGTVGNVILVSGVAETSDGEKLPYKVVLKIQKKWERGGDPNSWRREYDLCISDFGSLFDNNISLRWAECYHAEMNESVDETQLWLEYADGISGENLTVEMLEFASAELGRFQGMLYKNQQKLLREITCFAPVFTTISWAGDYYTMHRRETEEYRYIRSGDCEIPQHLRKMIIDIDDETESIFTGNADNMPVVLCHRDFWYQNIIYSDKKIILLDWDCTGWGYMFEDIIQLLTDEADVKYLEEYYCKFIPAYIKGFSKYVDISQFNDLYLYAWKMLAIKFAYTPVWGYMHAESIEEKNTQINTLQKIYEIKTKTKEF